MADFEQQYRALLENRLREFVGDTKGLKATFKVIEADRVAHGIAEYAHSTATDLLVLGSKGQSNLKYLLLGSTVERLLRKSLARCWLCVRPGLMAQSRSPKADDPDGR